VRVDLVGDRRFESGDLTTFREQCDGGRVRYEAQWER